MSASSAEGVKGLSDAAVAASSADEKGLSDCSRSESMSSAADGNGNAATAAAVASSALLTASSEKGSAMSMSRNLPALTPEDLLVLMALPLALGVPLQLAVLGPPRGHSHNCERGRAHGRRQEEAAHLESCKAMRCYSGSEECGRVFGSLAGLFCAHYWRTPIKCLVGS